MTRTERPFHVSPLDQTAVKLILLIYACIVASWIYFGIANIISEEAGIRAELAENRLLYTAGTQEWFYATKQADQEFYYRHICQMNFGLEIGSPLFDHCVTTELNGGPQIGWISEPDSSPQSAGIIQ